MFDVKCGLIKFGMDFVHGFESIVLEYFLPHFIPDIFLRVQLGRVRWEEMQNYISGDLKFVSAVVAGSVHNKQKNLEAFGIGRRHHQVDASSVLRADRAIQIDVFTNELAGDLWADADGCPARVAGGSSDRSALRRRT